MKRNNVSDAPVVQCVISQLKTTASREEFLDLHRQTAEWLAMQPGCLGYEVYEGDNGAIADRIVWASPAAAKQGNELYAQTAIAAGMQRIIERYTSFLGEEVKPLLARAGRADRT